MSLKEQLVQDMKAAMKAGDKQRLSVIRMARSALRNQEIDEGVDLDDNGVIAVLSKEVKQLRESRAGFQEAGRSEDVAAIDEQLAILQEYLPEPLSQQELQDLVKEAIDSTGAQGMPDMGRVMGYLMPKVKGRADGSQVSQMVREQLS